MSVVGQQRRPSVRCAECGTDLMAVRDLHVGPAWFCAVCQEGIPGQETDPIWARCHKAQKDARFDWSSVLRP